MSRKSSWWLRPQRKGASNRAALNEANYFMEHNKVLRERIKELAAENAKLRELVRDMWFADYAGLFSTLPEHQEHQATVWQRMRELGIEVKQ